MYQVYSMKYNMKALGTVVELLSHRVDNLLLGAFQLVSKFFILSRYCDHLNMVMINLCELQTDENFKKFMIIIDNIVLCRPRLYPDYDYRKNLNI